MPARTTERAHALLSASGAHRWLACPPSARLEDVHEDTSSEAAREGTFAHALAEVALRRALGDESATRPEGWESSPYYAPEMEEHVERYVDAVMEIVASHRAASPDALVLVESRLDFSEWVPAGFGTGDAVIASDAGIDVVDLKYGRGVRVEAANNAQLRLYALGALRAYGALYDARRVRTTIVQPRLDHIDSEELDVDDLLRWAEEYVAPRAKLAYAGEGEFAAGEHCRFCRAAATCRARAEANLEISRYDFAPPAELSLEEIADVLSRVDELVRWAGDVKDYAIAQVRDHGAVIPGWKLVEGRSVRRYVDEEKAAAALIAAGLDAESVYQRKLRTITDLEKTVGKKRVAEVLGDLIVKPPGAPTLAPESDKRPAISTVEAAARDFEKP